MPLPIPLQISRSMTLVRNPETGELTLFNCMRLSDAGLAELDALGKVAHVVRLAGFHGRDDAFYRERFGAKVYAITGQPYSRKLDPKAAAADNYLEPDVWVNSSADLPLPQVDLKILHSSKPPEALALLQRDGGILIAGDSLQNTAAPDPFNNWLAGFVMKRMGFFKPYGVGPAWLKSARPDAAELLSLLDLEFEHLLPAHGDPVLGQAKEKYRPALEAAAKGL